MKKIIVIGNSGSGKSTLAKQLTQTENLAHMDLDTLAWLPVSPPERRPVLESAAEITKFIHANKSWVIEGCYTDLIEIALPYANQLIYLNLSVEQCIENARKRPWEPHKYATKEAQDENLNRLIEWIAQYPDRTDTFSKAAHMALYENYSGNKKMVLING